MVWSTSSSFFRVIFGKDWIVLGVGGGRDDSVGVVDEGGVGQDNGGGKTVSWLFTAWSDGLDDDGGGGGREDSGRVVDGGGEGQDIGGWRTVSRLFMAWSDGLDDGG